MNLLRIPAQIYKAVLDDLRRPHKVAAERIGFLFAREAIIAESYRLLCAIDYWPVPDEGYIKDCTVGARINSDVIRSALQRVLSGGLSALHVHEHACVGHPSFSSTDRAELGKLMPSFHHLRLGIPHGALVLSPDSARGVLWLQGIKAPEAIAEVTIVGFPLQKFFYE